MAAAAPGHQHPFFTIDTDDDSAADGSTPAMSPLPSPSTTNRPRRPHSSLATRLRKVLPQWSNNYLPLYPSSSSSSTAPQSPTTTTTVPSATRQIPLGIFDISHGVLFNDRWYRLKHKFPLITGINIYNDNAVCNRKYNVLSFIPLVLYEQFRMFYNLFFLLVALSQLVPALRVGFFWTYFGPLLFVLTVSVSKEAFDDLSRYQRDLNINRLPYTVLLKQNPAVPNFHQNKFLHRHDYKRRFKRHQKIQRLTSATPDSDEMQQFNNANSNQLNIHIDDDTPVDVHAVKVASQDLRVGDIIVLDTNERVPADCVLLHATPSTKQHKSTAKQGTSGDQQQRDEGDDDDEEEEETDTLFIRTDQLDGETDWKLRRATATTQSLDNEKDILNPALSKCVVEVEEPKREIYDFVGTFINPLTDKKESLNLENTLWANTVIASGRAICIIIYNGSETRHRLNSSNPRSKIGKLDHEINRISKMLFFLLFSLSALLTGLRGFTGQWILYFCRFFLLLSAIIPISMRVNLDMAKIVYSMFIENDKSDKMKNCTVRNSNLPEELGRIEYVMSDKTGTLTQNEMAFKKLHLGNLLFARDALDDIYQYAKASFQYDYSVNKEMMTISNSSVALHPSIMNGGSGGGSSSGGTTSNKSYNRKAQIQVQEALLAIALAHNVTPIEEENGTHSLQAASPDEVALLKFAESVGFYLKERSMKRIVLIVPGGFEMRYDLLTEFPFTSEQKRMGIVVQDKQTGQISLYVKGADATMASKVKYNDWLDEECGNLAREGLRTLVYAKRDLTDAEYAEFSRKWYHARTSSVNRKEYMNMVQSEIEKDMKLLSLTGVEDKLQYGVRESLEKLKQAGIKVWMLTGDKVETATCIAISSRLVERSQRLFKVTNVTSRIEASRTLARYASHGRNDVLIIDGKSLQVMLDHFATDFIDVAANAPAAIACRCSPTQKAAVVELLQGADGKRRVAAIGDGGNDVGMIQQANVGIGIPGKEGMQASMAADFSIVSFHHIIRLLLWHGRNSYKRSARLSQFVIHRGLIISIIQTVYCTLFFYAAVSVYSGWILVGYATSFTMFPVFSLILDEDVNDSIVDTYPELYKDLQKGRSLNLKTFLIWVFKSIYQGTVIMVFSVYVIWDNEFFTTLHLSAVSFSALVLTELLMVAFEIHTWHWMMIVAQMGSVLSYIAAIFILHDTFDHSLMFKWGFLARVLVVTLVSCLPVTVGKWLKRKYAPAPYSKLA